MFEQIRNRQAPTKYVYVERPAYIITEKELVQLERAQVATCEAKIWHGPGHQSKTLCRKKGPHEVHEAVYGSGQMFAEWRGPEALTGFFDEPPELPE